MAFLLMLPQALLSAISFQIGSVLYLLARFVQSLGPISLNTKLWEALVCFDVFIARQYLVSPQVPRLRSE
jgi:hypothetical protein